MKNEQFLNYNYIIGKNAHENWKILEDNKKINDNFIWFHLNSFPSCYVILQSDLNTNNKTETEQLLTYGAKLCKENTKYKNVPNIKVVYTKLNKLLLTDKTGEVIIVGKKKLICL